MFYEIRAYNAQTLIAWASDANDVERYVDWLNRSRDIDLYAAREVAEADWPRYERRNDVLSMDEPEWDDFMEA